MAHRNAINLPCSSGGGCEAVAASRWAQATIGPWHDVSTALLGLLAYIALLTLAMLKLGSENPTAIRRWHGLLWGVTLFGAAYSIYLQWVAHFEIKAFCVYCFASACVMVVLFVTATVEGLTLRR